MRTNDSILGSNSELTGLVANAYFDLPANESPSFIHERVNGLQRTENKAPKGDLIDQVIISWNLHQVLAELRANS